MLLNMAYGPEGETSNNFEYSLYSQLWTYYNENYLSGVGSSMDFSNVNMGTLMDRWTENGFNYIEFWGDHWDDYRNVYLETVWNYYYDGGAIYNNGGEALDAILQDFEANNTHILVHLDGNQYLDITNSSDGYENCIDELDDTNAYLGAFAQVQHTYAIGIWQLNSYFYNFLKGLQNALINDSRYPYVYIWEKDPIEPDKEGLKIITLDILKGRYGHSSEDSDGILDKDTMIRIFAEVVHEGE